MAQSLEKFVLIIRCLSKGIYRFSDICKETGLPPSTAHRLLTSMVKLELALQDPVHRFYYLGPVVFEIASNQLNLHQRLIVIASPELVNLQTLTHETTALHALMGIYQACLDEYVSLKPIKYSIGKGSVGLAATGASGKVLLSQLDDTTLKALKRNYTAKNINLDALGQISSIRESGFAESIGERQTGAMGISAPVYNYFCPISVSVMGPENRILENRDTIIKLVKMSARKISTMLLSME